MNALQQLAKMLDKHHATLTIDDRADPPELLLRIRAQIASDGTIYRYGVEYRLGVHFLQRGPQAEPPTLESATWRDPGQG